jgi:hypothetical protein
MCTGAQHTYTGQVSISGQGSNSCTFENQSAASTAANLSCETEVLNGGAGSYNISFEANANCSMIGNFLDANPTDVVELHHSGYWGSGGWSLSYSIPGVLYVFQITVNPYGSGCPGPSSQSNVVMYEDVVGFSNPGAPSTNYAECVDTYSQQKGWNYRYSCTWQSGGGGLFCN